MDDECPGTDKCHGPLRWCSTCGDVDQVCDMRRRGERCDCHPLPPSWSVIKLARKGAEAKIAVATASLAEGKRQLAEVEETERVRRIVDKEEAEEDRTFWRAACAQEEKR